MTQARRFATPWEIALPPMEPPVAGHGSAEAGRECRTTGAPAALWQHAGPLPVKRGFDAAGAVWKRVFDLAFAAALLIVVAPVLVAVALALQLGSPGPVFFVQRRLGRGGRTFGCIKLRTMRADAERQLAALLAASPAARREWEATHKLRRDPRVSPLGRVVRRLSLDELPQLVNVLAGQMSVVGPRPIVAAEVSRYGAFYADYCAVKPGLTGLWQVSGRNDVCYGERVRLDRHYARHASVLLDLRIVLRTVPAVMGANGSY